LEASPYPLLKKNKSSIFGGLIFMRDNLLEDLNPLISDLIVKAKSGRFQGKEETHRLRIAYINALAGLLRAYNQLLKDKELNEIQEEIEELKEAINTGRRDYR